MKTVKKGLSTQVMVFIIITVASVAVAWVFTDIVFESEQQRMDVESLTSDAEFRMSNIRTYIENEIHFTGSRVLQEVSSNAGREIEDSRYWLCEGNPTPSTEENTVQTASNKLIEELEQPVQNLRGVRNSYVHGIGGWTANIKPGSSTDASQSTVEADISLNEVTVSEEDGRITLSDSQMDIYDSVEYNRFWYGHGVLKKWVEEKDFEDELEEALSDADTTGRDENQVCNEDGIEDPCEGNFPEAHTCGGAITGAEQEINEMKEHLTDELESSEDYFDNSGFECSIEPKSSGGEIYPGIETEPVNLEGYQMQTGECGDEEEIDEDECECQPLSGDFEDSCEPVEIEDPEFCEDLGGDWETDYEYDNPDRNEEMCEDLGGDHEEWEEETESEPECNEDSAETCQVSENCEWDFSSESCEVDPDWEPNTETKMECEGNDPKESVDCEDYDWCQEVGGECIIEEECDEPQDGECAQDHCELDEGDEAPESEECDEGEEWFCPEPDLEHDLYTCRTEWDHRIEAKVDYTLTCEDQRFNSITEEEKLDNLRWKIDLSYEGTEIGEGGNLIDCSTTENQEGPEELICEI